MAEIGNYIHYRWQNYLKYGNNYHTSGESLSYNYNQQKNLINKRVRSSTLTKEDKEELEKSIGYIFNLESDQVDQRVINAIHEVILEELNTSFNQDMVGMDWETGDIETIYQSVLNKKQIALQSFQVKKNQIKVHRAKIQSIIDSLQQAVDKLSVTLGSDDKTIINLQKSVNKVITSFDKLKADADKNIKTGDANKWIRTGIGIGKDKNKFNKNFENLKKDINTVIQFLLGNNSLNLLKGTAFEYIIALANFTGIKLGTNESEEVIKQKIEEIKKEMKATIRNPDIVMGGVPIATTYNFSYFSSDVLNTKDNGLWLDSVVDEQGNGIEVTTGNSQQKIDVKYIVSTEDEDINNIRIGNISTKNVGNNIHIVDDTPLLYLLQDEDANFVNHALNVMAKHPDTENGINTALASAREAVKSIVLYKALTGDVYGRENYVADVFVINNNKKGGSGSYQIFEMSELVEKALTDIDKYTIIKAGKQRLNNIRFENEFVEPEEDPSLAFKRIGTVLTEVHKAKINVSLKRSILS